MSTADPTSQPADQPPSQPPSQPMAPPARPNADQQHTSSVSVPRRRLVRKTEDRWIGGVCAGLADHLGLDVTLVRLLTVLVTVLGFGSVVIAYLVACLIVPKDTDLDAGTGTGTGSGTGSGSSGTSGANTGTGSDTSR